MTMRFGLSSTVLGAVAGVGVCIAGVVGWQLLRPAAPLGSPPTTATTAPLGVSAPMPQPGVAAPSAIDPAPAVTEAAKLTPPNPESASAAVLPEVPRFDTFRLAEDGTAILAGIAQRAETVAVLIDGAEVQRMKVERTGRFAAIFTLAPSTEPRMMTLTAYGTGGASVASEETILIAPSPLPALAQAAAPDMATQTQTQTQDAAPLPSSAPEVGMSAQPDATVLATADPALQPVATPASIVITPDGARKLEAPAPGVLAIDTISYASSGAVMVAGRGEGGRDLRLYLNNQPKLDTTVDQQGQWQGEMTDIAPGLYTLRADQLDPSGKVLARSETPFLREAPAAIAEASPAEQGGAQIVTVQPGYTLWGIAKSTYGEGLRYVQVFEANRDQIRNPDLIYPGQVFALPTAP